MAFNRWDPPPRPAFHDRAFVRAEMAPWDQRWHGRSRPARQTFLRLKVARHPGTTPPRNPVGKLPIAPLEELEAAGLVRLEGAGAGRNAAVPEAAYDFAARLRGLDRYHLLRDPSPDDFHKYVQHGFDFYLLQHALAEVLRQGAGLGHAALFGDLYSTFAWRRHWPDWAGRALKQPH